MKNLSFEKWIKKQLVVKAGDLKKLLKDFSEYKMQNICVGAITEQLTFTNKFYKYKIKKGANDLLLIPDPQITTQFWKKVRNYLHILALMNYIIIYKPAFILCIGDAFDLECLKDFGNLLETEKKRLIDDINAGNKFFYLINLAVKIAQKQDKTYKPVKVLTLGNHEERIVRLPKKYPALHLAVGYDMFTEVYDWNCHDLGGVADIHDVLFTHYFTPNSSSRAVTTTGEAWIKNNGKSCVMGHQQKYVNTEFVTAGSQESLRGIVAGAFYPAGLDLAGYKGTGDKGHWRGILHFRNMKNGKFDVTEVHLENLIKDYL